MLFGVGVRRRKSQRFILNGSLYTAALSANPTRDKSILWSALTERARRALNLHIQETSRATRVVVCPRASGSTSRALRVCVPLSVCSRVEAEAYCAKLALPHNRVTYPGYTGRSWPCADAPHSACLRFHEERQEIPLRLRALLRAFHIPAPMQICFLTWIFAVKNVWSLIAQFITAIWPMIARKHMSDGNQYFPQRNQKFKKRRDSFRGLARG